MSDFCCLSLFPLSLLLFERQQALLSLKFRTVWIALHLCTTALKCSGQVSSPSVTKTKTIGSNLYTRRVEIYKGAENIFPTVIL